MIKTGAPAWYLDTAQTYENFNLGNLRFSDMQKAIQSVRTSMVEVGYDDSIIQLKIDRLKEKAYGNRFNNLQAYGIKDSQVVLNFLQATADSTVYHSFKEFCDAADVIARTLVDL